MHAMHKEKEKEEEEGKDALLRLIMKVIIFTILPPCTINVQIIENKPYKCKYVV